APCLFETRADQIQYNTIQYNFRQSRPCLGHLSLFNNLMTSSRCPREKPK
ncbi:unnamed protein product, partial [Amoebophrya sp. A120]